MIKQFRARDIEQLLGLKDSETFGIYIGYQQIRDCIGPTKIGRTVNVKAIERGRSQGGADWWFHSFWYLPNRADTYEVEKTVKKSLKSYNIPGTQTQKELYSLSLDEAEAEITKILGKSML
jgi:hypothetical protein